MISAGLPPIKVIISQALEKSLSQLVYPPEKSLSPRPWKSHYLSWPAPQKSHYLSWSAPQKSHYPPGLGKVIISAGLPPRKVIIPQALEKSLSQLACPPKKSLSQLVCPPEKSLSPRPWKSHYLSWSAPQKSHYLPGLGKVIISAGLPPREVIISQALEKSLSQLVYPPEKSLSQLVCPQEKSLSPRPWKSHYLSWPAPQKSHYLSWSAPQKSHYPPGLGKVIIPDLGLVDLGGLSTRPKVKSHYPWSWSGCYGPAFDQTQSQKSLSLILVWLLWTRFRPDPKSKVIIPDLGLVAMDPLSTRPKVKSHYPWSWSGCYGPAFDQTQSQKSLSFLVWLLWTRFRPDPKSKVIILLGLVAMDPLSTRPKVKSHYPSWSGCYGPAFDQTQSQKSLSFLVWLLWTRFRPDPKSKVIILLGLVAMDPLSTRPKVKSHYPSWSGCYGPAFDQTQSQKSLSFLVWLLWTRFRPDPKSKVIILLGLVAMDPLSPKPNGNE